MVHHSNARIQNLTKFILHNVADYKSHFEVSDVKQDGTVFVRFKSVEAGTYRGTASELAGRFFRALTEARYTFVQVDVGKFRLPLDQFQV
jgi:hypothetical protein